MKQYFKIAFLFLLSISSYSQKGLDEVYQFNYMSLSPAMTGERGNYGLALFLGNQFNGTLRPNQVSQVFSIDGTINASSHAIGFQGFNNNLGAQRSSGFNLNYSYEMLLNDISLKVGSDVGAAILPNILNTTISERFKLFGGLGVLTKGDKWWLNISSPLLFSDQLAQQTLGGRKFNIMGGYFLGDSEILGAGISTLASLGANNTSNFHINTKVWIYDRWILGLAIRTTESAEIQNPVKLIPSLEYNLNSSSQFGIAFDNNPEDFRLTNFQQANNPSILQLFYRYSVFAKGDKPLLNLF